MRGGRHGEKRSMNGSASGEERMPAGNLREPSEVTIEGKDLVNAVLESQRDQVGVVDQVAGDPGLPDDPVEERRMADGLAQDPHDRRGEEVPDRFQRLALGLHLTPQGAHSALKNARVYS